MKRLFRRAARYVPCDVVYRDHYVKQCPNPASHRLVMKCTGHGEQRETVACDHHAARYEEDTTRTTWCGDCEARTVIVERVTPLVTLEAVPVGGAA